MIDAMNTMSRLTESQERFCQHYTLNSKPSAAYRFAYACSHWTANSIAVEASRMLNNPKISLRIIELQIAGDEAFKVTASQKKLWLQTIIERNIEVVEIKGIQRQGDIKAAITAITELNKMDGDHAAKKQELTGKDGVPIETRAMTVEEYRQTRLAMLKDDDC